MPPFLVYLAVLVGLFLMAFFTKRRFGRLGFALAVGYVMAGSLQDYSETINRYIGSSAYVSMPLITLVVVILPSVLMLFHGATYKTIPTRVIGALLFAILGFAIMVDSLSKVVVFQGLGMELFARISDSRNFIILVGLAVAVGDMFMVRSSHHSGKDKKH